MKFGAVIIFLLCVSPLLAQSDAADSSHVVYGIASFYSKSLQGTKTSTGEKFDHDLPTAASNNFKLGTWVRITNLRNGKSVVVRINDRMHKSMSKKGRVVDVTRSAAVELDFVKRGLTRVKVEEVPKGTTE
ncbi:septal ring lytic transglycosylase RlpA family protein [Danxiaibacter flavus]|uniref:Septal ring lytic transglycosylase RlpA family protein n=1 Tax=Danxiaibacter flavus TaxID=3049108 RepID=A0ABV3ZE22_9BACT|nr:septal ring lytic transglycosylase RlpA family protein [Chitinophagaceae bacterium DXS]